MFIKTGDADIFVNDFGQGGAKTLVAHGGWVGSGELWLQPFEQLRPISDSEFLHRQITGSRLVPIEDAGHVPTITRPTAVAAGIEAFFT